MNVIGADVSACWWLLGCCPPTESGRSVIYPSWWLYNGKDLRNRLLTCRRHTCISKGQRRDSYLALFSKCCKGRSRGLSSLILVRTSGKFYWHCCFLRHFIGGWGRPRNVALMVLEAVLESYILVKWYAQTLMCSSHS